MLKTNRAAILVSALALAGVLALTSQAQTVWQHRRSTVSVGVSNKRIDMPATIQSGMITFVVSNRSSDTMTVVLTGQDFWRRIASGLEPGDATTRTMRLFPGTYTVYSTAQMVSERGAQVQVQVVR